MENLPFKPHVVRVYDLVRSQDGLRRTQKTPTTGEPRIVDGHLVVQGGQVVLGPTGFELSQPHRLLVELDDADAFGHNRRVEQLDSDGASVVLHTFFCIGEPARYETGTDADHAEIQLDVNAYADAA